MSGEAEVLTEQEREALHAVLAQLSHLDAAGIRRVLAFAHSLATGGES